ncbi:hypothetical protein VB773_17255 [Haloarculaceae archaeon H-GB2-1]|nr:hypothetical protein [Haloarculaceae archaeon H-GB1-1]MEA5409145.1 hypothetical protein [Haloarculaceae archaeon H-GB2-1]
MTESNGSVTTATTATTRPGPEARDEIFVSPTGSDDATGSRKDPLDSIQDAFDVATPGDTITALPGEYTETVTTVRSGEPDAPITLTGPPDAVFRGSPKIDDPFVWGGLNIWHSHIHVRGLTFDGLADPANPDEMSSYVRSVIGARHVAYSPDHYHRNLVIKPHAVGNSSRALIQVSRVEDAEIGEFEVFGPAGMAMLKFGDKHHNGEVVYIGTAPTTLGKEQQMRQLPKIAHEPDTSSGVHVHHIDNSAGHPNAEFIDAKPGTSNVTIEYCTSSGSSHPTMRHGIGFRSAIRLAARDSVVRWCDISNNSGHGIGIAPVYSRFEDFSGEEDLPEEYFDASTGNAVYGNELTDNEESAIAVMPDTGLEAQDVICGNDYTGKTAGEPATSCPDRIPSGDGVGHLGGDSPWN